jgi:hypothetical protein
VAVHFGRGLRHEADERILHDIAGAVGITAEKAGGVAEERRLMARHGFLHQGAGIGSDMVLFRFDIHETLLL